MARNGTMSKKNQGPAFSNHAAKMLTPMARDKHLNVIGISAGYHDSACSLLQDGVLVAAAQEERFSRVKNDKSFPRRAFRYCLEQAGLNIGDVDRVAYYEDPTAKLGRQIWMGLLPEISPQRRRGLLSKPPSLRPMTISTSRY